jgi:tRNA(fMet)-specific endonuclease VapC
MLKYLLDTNIVNYVIKHRPLSVLDAFNRNSGRMAISSITLGELAHGVEKSSNPARNLTVVEDFTSRLEVLPYDDRAAWQYGIIRAALEKQDAPIGVNDLHIAGHARSLGLVIVTNNQRAFERVPGVSVENWVVDEKI